MDDQKRMLLAVVLSIVVFVGYYFFIAPPQEFVPPPPQTETASPAGSGPAPHTDSIQNPDKGIFSAIPAAEQVQRTEARKLAISTPLYHIVLSEYLGSVTSITLENYRETIEKDSGFKQLIPAILQNGVMISSMKGKTIQGLDNAVFKADMDSLSAQLTQGEKKLTFSWTSPGGVLVQKVYTFQADTYLIQCEVFITNHSGMPVNDSLVLSIPGVFNDEIKKRSRFAFEGPITYINKEFITIAPDDIAEQNLYAGTLGWAGFSLRYFMLCAAPAKPENYQLALSYEDQIVNSQLIAPTVRIDPGQTAAASYTLYMGPKSYKILSSYDDTFKKAINFGWFDILAKPLLITMNVIYSVIPNYGIAIILLTILIKILFWPLGTKSYKSMNQMKKVQPLMMEIREKYKDDKQKMNQEVMNLYKTYKVNPASGCLPLLVQMPIFFALYRMLYQAIELRHAPFMGWITDLSGPDRLFHFSFAIPMMQPPYGIPVLTLLMGLSFLIQQKMTPTAGDPAQAKMMMIMPIIMTVLFINFPAGLVLYMFVNNIISMGQQYYTQKKFSK